MDALLEWHQRNGGYLHEGTKLEKNAVKGCHLVASHHLAHGTTIVTVPHNMALSCLNAMVDDSLPVLKANAESFTVEALGVFYLMAQWIQRDTSFYKPFLDILQSPEDGFNAPHWFDQTDMLWLNGTDLSTSFETRRSTWHRYWRDGTAILASDGMDVSQFTWDLCKWAATVFTSRSLSSRALRPSDTKYWTAYKQGPNGRQTVLLDLSKVSEERKDFPVLIPVMDCLNHHHDAHVDWRFEPGRFELSLASHLSAGAEVLNNYGPKSNSELLLGYGFCVDNNPFDCVYQALRPPPHEVQIILRRSHAGYFRTDGTWNAETTVFKLVAFKPQGNSDVWQSIPIELTELFYYIVRYNRGLTIDPIESSPRDFLLDGAGRIYLPSIATMILTSLPPKYHKILAADEDLPDEPKNDKQRYAKIYRDGQRTILESLQLGFSQYLVGLRDPRDIDSDRGGLISLREGLEYLKDYNVALYECFETGIRVAFGEDVSAATDSEVEFNVWVLWLCFCLISHRRNSSLEQHIRTDMSRLQRGMLHLEREYPVSATEHQDEEEDEEEMLIWRDLLAKAASATQASQQMNVEHNPWTGSEWNAQTILDFGVRVVSSQSVTLETEKSGPHVYLYMHAETIDPDQ